MEKYQVNQELLHQRIEQMKEAQDNPKELYDLYFILGNDIAIFTEHMNYYLSQITMLKSQNKDEYKSVSEFNRYIESSEEHLYLKVAKNTINALEHLKSSIRFKISGIEGEKKGQY